MSIVCEVVTPLTRATTWLATVEDSMSMSASSHRGPLQPSHAHTLILRLPASAMSCSYHTESGIKLANLDEQDGWDLDQSTALHLQ